MKIEFIHEIEADGNDFYFTRVNGSLVNGSLRSEYSKAHSIYKRIASGAPYGQIVLESTEFTV